MEIIKANVHLLPVVSKQEKGQIGCESNKINPEKNDVIRFMFPVLEAFKYKLRTGRVKIFNLYLTIDSLIFKNETYLNVKTGEILVNKQNVLNDQNCKKIIATTDSNLNENILKLDYLSDQEITSIVCKTYNDFKENIVFEQINFDSIFTIEIEKKKLQNKIIKKQWYKLKGKFKELKDIPSLPTGIDPSEWKRFYVWKLVKMGAIPKEKLKDGFTYYGKCRNNDVAIWNQEKNCFEYERTKFGVKYYDKINHFEDDNGYDLFVPIKKIPKNKIKTT